MTEQRPFTVHLAKPDDLEEIVSLNQRAYNNSPVQNYFAGLSSPITADAKDAILRKNQESYLRYLYKRAFNDGDRPTIAVTSDSGTERIVASAIWKPPKSQKLSTKTGFFGGLATQTLLLRIIRGWGIGFLRKALAATRKINKVVTQAYKERDVKESNEEHWYLEMVAVDPEFHGKGLMSLLFREAFEHAPSATYTLFANSPSARDRYAHWGFESWKEVIVGKGECDERGITTKAGSGFVMYLMVKNLPRTT